MDYRWVADLRMSPCTGNKLSHWSLQSRLFSADFGWWFMPELWVFFVLHIRAVCLIFWNSVLIGNPASHRSVTSPALWYLICVALLLHLSLTCSLCDCTTEKKHGVFFFEEEETSALQTLCLKVDEVQQVPSRWQKRVTTGSEICTVHQKRKMALLDKFIGFMIFQI